MRWNFHQLKKKLKFRPFLVKEQKILMIAQESKRPKHANQTPLSID